MSRRFKLYLTMTSSISADTSQWLRADFAVELMRHVSVGPGGIFAVKAKDDSVWYRTYEQAGKPTGKVVPDTDHGVLWNKIQVGSLVFLKYSLQLENSLLEWIITMNYRNDFLIIKAHTSNTTYASFEECQD